MIFVILAFAAAALLAGFGGYLIARKLSGVRAWAIFLLWLVLPFVVLAFTLSASIDPTLTQAQADYDFAMAWMLASAATAVPWFGANLVGALLGLSKRKAGPKIAAVFEDAAVATPAAAAEPKGEPL